MPNTRYALKLTEENFDLITVLNGGIRPFTNSDDFYVFQVDGKDTTTDHQILSLNHFKIFLGKHPDTVLLFK